MGATAGSFEVIISNPADEVITRPMTAESLHRVSISVEMTPVSYRDLRDAIMSVAREEGVSAFGYSITPINTTAWIL